MTSTSTPVTFVLVPGSFTRALEYDKVAALLEKAGHKVKLVDLPSVNDGSRRPPATVDDDTEHIHTEILSVLDDKDSPTNVVLAVHSYGGIPGTGSVKGLNQIDREKAGKSTAVLGVCYVAAYLPDVDESVRTLTSEYTQEPFKSGIPGEYFDAIPFEWAKAVFSDLTDDDEIKKYHSYMARHSSDSFGGLVKWAGWKDESLKVVQMIPMKDVTIPLPVQEMMAERASKTGKDGRVRTVRLEGLGHCFNVSRPELIVDELYKLAEL